MLQPNSTEEKRKSRFGKRKTQTQTFTGRGKENKVLFIFAGEPSGDLHGAELISALLKKDPSLVIMGVGGPRMRALGMHVILPMETFQVMGFFDVFLALPRLIKAFYYLRRFILQHNPNAAVFIDYPGFNLRMEKALRKKNFQGKVCHYICPSIWAWGKKRIPTLAKNLDELLTILPFEAHLLSHTRLSVRYVGHPLVQKIKHYQYQDVAFSEIGYRLVSLFPGSRKKEIERNLPIYLQVVKALKTLHSDLHFALSLSSESLRPLIEKIMHDYDVHIPLIPTHHTYELMRASHVAIAKSGTVTLELALHEIPTIVTYGLSSLDFFIAYHVLRIRLPYYCIVNILAQKSVFPELIGPNFTEQICLHSIARLLSSKDSYTTCVSQCQQIKALLQNKEASTEAAAAIYNLLGQMT